MKLRNSKWLMSVAVVGGVLCGSYNSACADITDTIAGFIKDKGLPYVCRKGGGATISLRSGAGTACKQFKSVAAFGMKHCMSVADDFGPNPAKPEGSDCYKAGVKNWGLDPNNTQQLTDAIAKSPALAKVDAIMSRGGGAGAGGGATSMPSEKTSEQTPGATTSSTPPMKQQSAY